MSVQKNASILIAMQEPGSRSECRRWIRERLQGDCKIAEAHGTAAALEMISRGSPRAVILGRGEVLDEASGDSSLTERAIRLRRPKSEVFWWDALRSASSAERELERLRAAMGVLPQLTLADGRRTPFMTGATGFLGSTMLNALLLQPGVERVFVLSRDSHPGRDDAEARIFDKLDRDQDRTRVVVLRGELGRQMRQVHGRWHDQNVSCFLPDRETPASAGRVQEMLRDTNEVIHVAALLNFAKDATARDELFDVNSGGTRRVLNIVDSLRSPVKAVWFVSTAFVHGRRSAPEEHEENDPPETMCQNPYEDSKVDAERRLSGYPALIVRAPILLESSTIRASSSETIYGIADALHMAMRRSRQHRPHIRVPGDPDALTNFIEVADWVNTWTVLCRTPLTGPQAFNIVNPVPTSTADFWAALAEVLGFTHEFVSWVPEPRNYVERCLYERLFPLYDVYMYKSVPTIRFDNVRVAVGESSLQSIRRIGRTELAASLARHLERRRPTIRECEARPKSR